VLLPLTSPPVPDGAEELGGGTPAPVLGDNDRAAMLTPVLLAGFAVDSFAFSSFLGTCFDLLLFFDLEEDVVEVDLSSLTLLDASLFEMSGAVFARAVASGVLTVLVLAGDGLNAGMGNCRASGDD